MILLIDNYDSFTYNLQDYFLQIGLDCKVARNDEYSLQEFSKLKLQAVVFSPGPKIPREAGLMMELINYFHDKILMLGICLGHQGIGEFFGAKLVKAKIPMHGKTSMITHNNDFVFQNIPQQFKVMRYHSLILSETENSPLKIIARTDENEIMAIKHNTLPIYGFQFHPEAILTEHGLQLLKNWAVINDLL